MSVTEFPDLERAREEASQWIARLDRGLLPAERADLRQWCAMTPANARALRQMSELWAELNVMKALADVFPEGVSQTAAAAALGMSAPVTARNVAAEVDCAQVQAAPFATTADAAQPSAAITPRRWARPAIAAGLVIGLGATGFAVWVQQHGGGPVSALLAAMPDQSYSSSIGEQRDYALADGSSLAVNSGSLVEVLRLDDAVRELRLQRGEALFSVAHDPARPFRVAVGGHIVEAVGTAFDVRLHQGGVIEVVVTEGRVRLLSGSQETGQLEHGQAMHIDTDGTTHITHLDEQQLAARMAWRRGMIEFRGQPLAEALEEFARYTPVRVVVTDPAAARTPIGGSVPAGDVEWLLDALHTNFGLESSRAPDGSIHIAPPR